MQMLIYTDHISNRLKYVTEFIFQHILDTECELTMDNDYYQSVDYSLKICYSEDYHGGLQMNPNGFMASTEISELKLESGEWLGLPTLFHDEESQIPFDLFSAIFYLISRYEEYVPSKKDQHGRFQAEESIAFRNDFLDRPIVNEWCQELGNILGLPQKRNYEFIASFDIDHSYAFSGKGPLVSLGGAGKDIIKFKFKQLFTRIGCWFKITKDPNNSFDYIFDQLEENNIKKSIFFVLNGARGPFDKNLPLSSILQQKTIAACHKNSEIGIHPSYGSNDEPAHLKTEIQTLSNFIERSITKSRQHYLKCEFPTTFENLIANNISEDYTLGYAQNLGFRASTCTPFPWYNLAKEEATNLTMYPLGAMDVTFKNYLRLNPQQSINALKERIDTYRKYNGTFVLLWHNSSFNEDEGWKNWKRVFENALKLAKA